MINFCVENFVLCVRISNIQGGAPRALGHIKSTVQKFMSYRVEIDDDGDVDDDGSRGNCNDVKDINDVSYLELNGQMNQMY